LLRWIVGSRFSAGQKSTRARAGQSREVGIL